MRTWIAVVAALAGLGAWPAAAQDKLTLGLKWLPQAQFAGYYVALDRGYYKAERLDVTIKPGGPDPAPPQMLRSGAVDVAVDWMPSALAAREAGVAMVNIGQIFKRSGLWLTCRRDTGIRRPTDLKGRTIGVWYGGNEYPFLAWTAKVGLQPGEMRLLKQGFDVDLLLSRQADCISTMSYNEYGQVRAAGLQRRALTVFRYDDHGVATLEDGLYAMEDRLADAAVRQRLGRFLRASIKGWQFAIDHPDAAVAVVMKAIDAARGPDAAAARKHQSRMMSEVAKLVDKDRLGWLNPRDYERTVATLLVGGSDPVITRRPTGAWTHAVWAAMK
jgi:NitT/TauT family transport system substrate-binding protein